MSQTPRGDAAVEPGTLASSSEYGISLLCFGLAVALTKLFSMDASTCLFFCLGAVAVTANYCSLRPRLLTGVLTSLFAAYHLPPDGTLAISGHYLKLFALFVIVTGFLCFDGAQRLQARRLPAHPAALPRPRESPEAILDREIKRVAGATGNITLAQDEVYHWMRQCAHFRDLVWNIDDSWRRRDWTMLNHSISLAYHQVSVTEQKLLQTSVTALAHAKTMPAQEPGIAIEAPDPRSHTTPTV